MKNKMFLVMVFIIAIFSFSFVNVKADRVYDKVYYVTDNPNYQNVLSSLQYNSSYYYNDFEVVYYDNSYYYNSLYFVEDVYNGYTNFYYLNITDSCIIFECNYDFDVREYNYDHSYLQNYYSVSFNYFSFMLTDMFSYLKSNGRNNDICFICATDQNRFSSRSFLNYVDFHIDTDTYYLFMQSVIAYCEANYANPINGLSFLLNNGMYNPNLVNSFFESYIYKNYFKPYLYYYYGSGCYSDNDLLNTAARTYGLHFYFNTNDLEYCEYDYLYNGFYDVIDLEDDELPPSDFVFLGQYYNSLIHTDEYLYNIIEFEIGYGIDVPFFFYNSSNQDITAYTSNEDIEHFYPGYTAAVAVPTLPNLLLYFIEGEDITVYDNWQGVCYTTHKMVNFSLDGWMINSGYREEFDIDFAMSF